MIVWPYAWQVDYKIDSWAIHDQQMELSVI